MTKLSWGNPGDRLYEAGIERGVLYPELGPGVVWNGLVSVKESPSDVDATASYQDGAKYNNRQTLGSFAASLEAFTYPDEFTPHDGVTDYGVAQQHRKPFGLSYVTGIGNDIAGASHGYKIHLVYNALATPSKKNYPSLSDNNDTAFFIWDLSTTPLKVLDGIYSAHLVIDTTKAYPWAVKALEEILYGKDYYPARMPSTTEIMDLFEDASIVQITDNGDGTWTADGPDEYVYFVSDTSFAIDWPTAVYIDQNTYTVASL